MNFEQVGLLIIPRLIRICGDSFFTSTFFSGKTYLGKTHLFKNQLDRRLALTFDSMFSLTKVFRSLQPLAVVFALMGILSFHSTLLAEDQPPSSGQQAPEQSVGIPTESYPDYPKVGKEAGVWNDGQAAVWDLHILDHYRYFGPAQRAKGYKPEQPINFSHIVHVQKNKMECQYCHWNVSKGSYAALPDVESCMGCHSIVQGSDEASKAEIKKLQDIYQKGDPIEWLKVHVMPDHYKFNHKRHVKGGVACHECHGQVPEMDKVERVSSMKMGWCIDCHRTRGASIDCATCHY